MLQSTRLKDNLHTIGIDQYLSKNAIYEHKCLQNIKKLYKQAGKCDYRQEFKNNLEHAMVSASYGFTDNSKVSPMKSASVKKTRARKSLCMFTNIVYVKKIL